MTGRGLRIHPGKTDCIVLDLVDVARRHSLQTAPVLYGLPPGLKAEKGKTLDQLEDEFAELMEKYPQLNVADMGRKTLSELSAAARTFDIWSVREMEQYGQGLTMQWIRTDDEAFRIQYPWNDGTETITVSKDLLGHFEVRVTAKSNQGFAFGPGTGAGPRVLAAGVITAQAALHLAEAYVAQERRSVSKLKDRDAPWRTRPASEKQLGLLRKLRIPHNAQKLTMGGASDLIDLHHVRRGR
jgi:ATP-dependent helicase IRC3